MSLGGASPLSPTNFVELKPQQTGTRLLIGYGEVATTSGSTNLLGLVDKWIAGLLSTHPVVHGFINPFIH